MKIEHCDELGDYAITFFCKPNFGSIKPLKHKGIIMTSELPIEKTAAIVSMSSLLDLLKRASSELVRVVNHPSQQLMVGFRAADLKKLEIVAVRLKKEKQDMFPEDHASETQNETEATRHSNSEMKNLGDRATKNQLDAEELVATFNAQPDPSLARRQFASIGSGTATIYDDVGVLLGPKLNPVPHKFISSGTYTLEVRVAEFSPHTNSVKFALVNVFEKQPFFNNHDLDQNKTFDAVIPNANIVTLVGLCAAYQLPLKVVMTLEVQLSSKGILSISGTVTQLENKANVINSIQSSMRQFTADLFDAT
ncbi:MAG: hypothetical protein COW02_01655 [Comamonadaceae bacterium CG12_big_fil_rev_8_21_14_0_65_59_15]|nr:MAG: hypothetical protein COW02_01655 [Comamonadaceae bacterium CG12_big_fil_rev_8_21_14_0_65_59_15]